MKKLISILLALCMFAACIVGCSSAPAAEDNRLKVGLICLHDSNSTYDKNFIDAFNAACEKLNVQGIIKTNVAESSDAYDAAVELADAGCSIVFADSFGHEDYMIQAALEFPGVEFAHATGTKAHTEGIANYHNAFASIYEGRYLDGVAAGMKLKEMNLAGDVMAGENVVGYVAAHPYAECISGFTAFYLGVKSVAPTATMKVIYTGSWYDETLEMEAANNLINNGCVLISGHADSMGIPNACEAAGVPFVFYNGDISQACPNTYIISTRINWQPYFEYLINCKLSDTPIDTDWVGTLANGAVTMTDINNGVAAVGTQDAIDILTEDLINNNIFVFDTSTFTVDGETLTSYEADVDTDANYTPDTEVIEDGIFYESRFRSAPYFDIIIDGITVLE